MKIKNLLLPFLILLSSCQSQRSVNPQEIPQDSTYLSSLESVDPHSVSQDNRTDPILDPLSAYKPTDFSAEQRSKHPETIAQLSTYFSSDYTIEPWESLSPSGKSLAFYLDAYGNEGDWKVAFFDNTLAPYSQRSQLISPLVSGIYSKGKWSYALTSFQDGKRIFDQLLVSMKKQMYAVVHASSFPYDVYYDADTLYLINQDPAFSEDYFAKFKAAQGKIYRLK